MDEQRRGEGMSNLWDVPTAPVVCPRIRPSRNSWSET